ncbi:MAG: SagB/ThcOx family dehydrogenase [Ignavibacteriaceae bacterium]|jgi:SagB-type dehydrogenase family enzyme
MAEVIKKTSIQFIIIIFFSQLLLVAQNLKLPPPQKDGGIPLMEAINKRKSSRKFISKELSSQVLSNLLWAAYGFNRPEKEMRTVPSAWNIQNINVYIAKSDGLYLYDAANNILKLILREDIRQYTGKQSYVNNVPVNLIYVADLSMMSRVREKAKFYSTAQTGFIAQNVYLFCASFNLGTVVRDLIDRDNLRKIMNLKDNEEIILAQSVGYLK